MFWNFFNICMEFIKKNHNIILPVFIAFALERIHDFYQNNVQKKENLNKVRTKVLEEIDYNITPGIGLSSPFKLKAHGKLLEHNIPPKLKNDISDITKKAGQVPKFATPGTVKSLEKQLKDKIVKL